MTTFDLASPVITQNATSATTNIVDTTKPVVVSETTSPGEATTITAWTTVEVERGSATYAISGNEPSPTGDTSAPRSWPLMYVATSGGQSTAATWSDSAPAAPTNYMPVPGLLQYWRSGFDMKLYSFSTSDIFTPTYTDPSHTVTFGGPYSPITYCYPDHIDYENIATTYDARSKQLIKTESDYKWTYTLQIVDSGGVPKLSSISDDTTFTYKGEVLSNSECVYEQQFRVCQMGHSTVDTSAAFPLDPRFLNKLNEIVAANTPTDDRAWGEFFGAFGTHYLASGNFGGFTVFTSSIDKSLLTRTNEVTIQDKLKESYSDVISSNTMTESAFFDAMNKESDFSENVHTSINARGGTPQANPDQFNLSVYSNPVLLTGMFDDAGNVLVDPPVFGTFADFCSDETGRALVDAATTAYVGVNASAQTGLFSEITPGQVDVAVAAPGDCLVIIQTATNNQVVVLSDATESPSTVRATISGYNAVTVPVLGGQTYQCHLNVTSDVSDSPPTVAAMQPPVLPNDAYQQFFGAWASMPDLTPPVSSTNAVTISWQELTQLPFTTSAAGILVASWQAPLAKLWSDHEHPFPCCAWVADDTGRIMGGGGVTYMVDGARGATSSQLVFAVPLPAGSYTLCINQWAPGLTWTSATTAFVPFTGIQLGSIQSLSWNTAFQASTDGFCVATATATGPGPWNPREPPNAYSCGSVDLTIRTGVASNEVTAGTTGSFQFGDVGATVWYGSQTVMLPITEGSWYSSLSAGAVDSTNSFTWFLPVSSA